MIKNQFKVQCLAALFLPFISLATESDFIEAKAFVESVYVHKEAKKEESQYSKIFSFLSTSNCNTKYTDYTNSYAYIHFHNQGSSGASFTFNEHSDIQFEKNENNEIIELTIKEIEYFDCEEEGCSQEGPVLHTFSMDQISSQTYSQGSNYGYDLVTSFCNM